MKCSRLSRERLRSLFLISNTIFLGLGLTSLIIGVWLYLEKNDFLELTPSSFSAFSAAGLCSFSGATIAIISAVGCISVTINGRCLLVTYLSFVGLLILVQTVTGLTGFFYKESTREKIRDDLFLNINRSYASTNAGRIINLQVSWDHLHESLHCCGVDSYEDWYRTSKWPQSDYVPSSCCDPTLFSSNATLQSCGKLGKPELWYNRGCYNVFADWLYHHIHIVSFLSFVLILSELSNMVFGLMVCCNCGSLPSSRRRSRSDSYRYNKGNGTEEDKLTSHEP